MGVRGRVSVRHRIASSGVFGAVTVAVAGPIAGLGFSRLIGHLPTAGPLSRLAAAVVLYGAGLAAVGVGYLALTGRLGDLRPVRPDAEEVRLVAAVTAGLVLAWVVAVVGLAVLGVPFAGNALTAQADGGFRISLVLLAGLSLVVIAPTEELLYRGVVQASLYDVTSRRRAVVAASVPFALAHVPTLYADTSEPSAVGLSLIAVFGLSRVFGWLHARTDDIVAPTAVHGGYNCLVFCLLYLVGV